MKKLIFSLVIGLTASGAYAACQGGVCYDESSVQIVMPLELTGLTTTQMVATSPLRAGQLIYIIPGLNAPTRSSLCISTGTGRGAYTMIQSTSVVGFNGAAACH